jgi:hypothetical protein
LRTSDERSECFICANVPNKSSRIEVRTIFFETNNRVYYYQVKLFSGECFLDAFEALRPEIDIRALVLQDHSKSIRTSARTSILRHLRCTTGLRRHSQCARSIRISARTSMRSRQCAFRMACDRRVVREERFSRAKLDENCCQRRCPKPEGE